MKLPNIAKIWYGDTETAADTSGEKAIGDMGINYAQKYVRVAPVSIDNSGEGTAIQGPESPKSEIPQTEDNSIIWLWMALVLVSTGMFWGSIYWKKKEGA